MINLKRQYGACQRISKATAVLLLSTTAVFAEPITIAAMGDSLTQGYGLQAEQGFVPQLQAWLDENGADAKIVNAGVSGDTTAGLGLLAAIPAVIFYNKLSADSARIVGGYEAFADEFSTILSRQLES